MGWVSAHTVKGDTPGSQKRVRFVMMAIVLIVKARACAQYVKMETKKMFKISSRVFDSNGQYHMVEVSDMDGDKLFELHQMILTTAAKHGYTQLAPGLAPGEYSNEIVKAVVTVTSKGDKALKVYTEHLKFPVATLYNNRDGSGGWADAKKYFSVDIDKANPVPAAPLGDDPTMAKLFIKAKQPFIVITEPRRGHDGEFITTKNGNPRQYFKAIRDGNAPKSDWQQFNDDMDAQKADTKLMKQFHALGTEVYGDGWDDKRKAFCTYYKVESSNDLNVGQVNALIKGMQEKKPATPQPPLADF